MSASFKETLVLQLTQDLPDSPVPLVSWDGRMLDLDEVEVHIQLETRGEAHSTALLATLRERGFRVYQ